MLGRQMVPTAQMAPSGIVVSEGGASLNAKLSLLAADLLKAHLLCKLPHGLLVVWEDGCMLENDCNAPDALVQNLLQIPVCQRKALQWLHTCEHC